MTNDDQEGRTPEELREDVERNRAELGETVEALADKAHGVPSAKEAMGNVTTQARQTIQTAKEKAGPVAQQAQVKAREFATKARETATSPDVQAQARRSGPAVAVGAGAIVLTVWALRRRRARRMTRWDRTTQAVQRTGAQARDRLRDAAAELQSTVRESDLAAQARDRLRDKAAELQAAVRDSDLAAQAQERGQAAAAELAARTRQAAEAPETKPRAQGAAAAVGLLLVLGCLRRSRASRRRQRTE